MPDAPALAIAAALLATNAGHGEWNSWSTNSERAMWVKFGESDIALRFAAGAFRARIGDGEIVLSVVTVDAPLARIAIGDVVETVTFHIEEDTVHLARAGQSFTLRNTTPAPPTRRRAAAGDGRLIAPMNGRVVAVNASVGDTAEPGKALVVLEAMKMEHALSVPQSARVKAVHVAPGEQVAPGHLLLELEPNSAARQPGR
jgi:geranyl-CoA carboxylase alpha subunit